MKTLRFFMALKKIPRTTHQQQQVRMVNGKPIFYEPDSLKQAREIFLAHLAIHKPQEMFAGNVRLTVKWCFPVSGKHTDGEYKSTKPDLDNLMKLLQDCMTKLGYWKDDRFVVSLITEKYWADLPGIFIQIDELGEQAPMNY